MLNVDEQSTKDGDFQNILTIFYPAHTEFSRHLN